VLASLSKPSSSRFCVRQAVLRVPGLLLGFYSAPCGLPRLSESISALGPAGDVPSP